MVENCGRYVTTFNVSVASFCKYLPTSYNDDDVKENGNKSTE